MDFSNPRKNRGGIHPWYTSSPHCHCSCSESLFLFIIFLQYVFIFLSGPDRWIHVWWGTSSHILGKIGVASIGISGGDPSGASVGSSWGIFSRRWMNNDFTHPRLLSKWNFFPTNIYEPIFSSSSSVEKLLRWFFGETSLFRFMDSQWRLDEHRRFDWYQRAGISTLWVLPIPRVSPHCRLISLVVFPVDLR